MPTRSRNAATRRFAIVRPGSRAGAAAFACLLALLSFACAPQGSGQRQSPGATEAGTPRSDVGFRSHELLVEHFDKHGREFGGITMEEYLRQAQSLRDRPAGGDVLEIVRGDGVVTRFERRTGAFIAFARSGVIRTFFKPRDGERYFRRQALRDGGNG